MKPEFFLLVALAIVFPTACASGTRSEDDAPITRNDFGRQSLPRDVSRFSNRGGDLGVERIPPTESDMTSIVLVRQPCNGRCPQDLLRIDSDGRARYEGGKYAKRSGTYVATVDSAAMFAAIGATNVERLRNRRLASVSDEPYVTIAITRRHGNPVTVGAISYHDLPAQAAAAYLVLEGIEADIDWAPADGVAEWLGDYEGPAGTFALWQSGGTRQVNGNAANCRLGAPIFSRVVGGLRIACGSASSMLRHVGHEVEVTGNAIAPGRYQPVANKRTRF